MWSVVNKKAAFSSVTKSRLNKQKEIAEEKYHKNSLVAKTKTEFVTTILYFT